MKKFFTFFLFALLATGSWAIDWSSIAWTGDGIGGCFEKYKVSMPEGTNCVNLQKPGFATKGGFYMTFPAADISITGFTFDQQGAGIILHVDQFTQQETLVPVVCNGGTTYNVYVYYADGTATTPSGDTKTASDLALTSPATVSFDLADASLTSQITYTSSSTGAVTYSSSAASVATVSESGLITAVGTGSAIITIAQAADDNYAAGNLSVTVSVSNSAIAGAVWYNGRYYASYGVRLSYTITRNSDATLSYKVAAKHNKTGFVMQVNDGSFHTMTLSDDGYYTYTSTTTYTDGKYLSGYFYPQWAGGAGTYGFYYPIGTTNVSATLNVSSIGYATYYSPRYSYVMPEGLTGYIFNASTKTIVATYNAGDVVPFEEALILKGNEGSYTLNFIINADSTNVDNALLGSEYALTLTDDANYYFYGLSTNAAGDASSAGLYWMNDTGSAFAIGANQAYLKLAKETDAPSFYLFESGETPTGIDALEATEGIVKYFENGQLLIKKGDVIYNALGQIVK